MEVIAVWFGWIATQVLCVLQSITPDWLSAIGTLGAVIVALFGESLRQFFARSRLEIEFTPAEPDVSRNFLRQIGESQGQGIPVLYFRIRLVNRGRAAAQNASVYASKLARFEGGELRQIGRFAPMLLPRSYGQGLSVESLPTDIPFHFDIFFIAYPGNHSESGQMKWNPASIVFTLSHQLNADNVRFESGHYQLEVMVSADNTKTVVWLADIDFGGVWPTSPNEMPDSVLTETNFLKGWVPNESSLQQLVTLKLAKM